MRGLRKTQDGDVNSLDRSTETSPTKNTLSLKTLNIKSSTLCHITLRRKRMQPCCLGRDLESSSDDGTTSDANRL